MSRFDDDDDLDIDPDEVSLSGSFEKEYEDYDRNDNSEYLVQGLLQKQKAGFFGGVSWKEKWASLDNDKLMLWPGTSAPTGEDVPDDGYILAECYFRKEVKSERKFAFTIGMSKEKDNKVTLCCKNLKEFDLWIGHLNGTCREAKDEESSVSNKAKDRDSKKKGGDAFDDEGDLGSVDESKNDNLSSSANKNKIATKSIIQASSAQQSLGGVTVSSNGSSVGGQPKNTISSTISSRAGPTKNAITSTIQNKQSNNNNSNSNSNGSVVTGSVSLSNSKPKVYTRPSNSVNSASKSKRDQQSSDLNSRSSQAESMSQAVALVVQNTLFKYKAGLFGSSWKEKYVYSDDEKLFQFRDSDKPEKMDELPDFFVALRFCKVETAENLRKYAFTVTNTSPDVPENTKITLATDDKETYKSWMLHLEKYCLVGKSKSYVKAVNKESSVNVANRADTFDEEPSQHDEADDSFGEDEANGRGNDDDNDDEFDYENVNLNNNNNNANANNQVESFSIHSSDFRSENRSQSLGQEQYSVGGGGSLGGSQNQSQNQFQNQGQNLKKTVERQQSNSHVLQSKTVLPSPRSNKPNNIFDGDDTGDSISDNGSVKFSEIDDNQSVESKNNNDLDEGDGKRGFNKKGQIVYVEGRLWKMKVGTFTGITWKPKWVYLDFDKLLQWSGEFKPDASAQPSNGMPLRQCQVRESKYRVYAFNIINVEDNTSLTFAASNAVEYDNFMQLFKRYCTIVDSQGQVINKSDLLNESDTDSQSEKQISVLLDSDDDDDKSEDSDLLGLKTNKLKKGLKTPVKTRQSLNDLVSPALREKHILPLAKGYSRDVQADALLFLEGPLLKLKSKFLSGAEIWKVKWVYADSSKFLQWQSETKPKDSNELPNVGFPLALSSLEKHPHKDTPFAFRIIEKTSKTNLIFAAANEDDYKAWMKLLMKSVNDVSGELEAEQQSSLAGDDSRSVTGKSESIDLDIGDDDDDAKIPSNINEAQFGSKDDVDLDELAQKNGQEYDDDSESDFTIETISTVVGKFRPLEQDAIMNLFSDYNIVNSARNPHIAFENISKIVEQLKNCDEYRYVDPLVGILIFKDLGLMPGSSAISYAEFIQWWHWHKDMRGSPRDSIHQEHLNQWRNTVNPSPNYFGMPNTGGFMNSPQLSRLMAIQIPSLDDFKGSRKPFTLNEQQNWNTLYQDTLDKVLQGSSSNFGIAKDFDNHPRAASRFDNRFNLKDFVKFQRIYGSFTMAAASTAAMLIDEFCLPDEFKHFDVVQDASLLTKYGALGSSGNDDGNTLVYGSGGIIFVISENFAEKSIINDNKGDNEDLAAKIQPVDELFRKICGNEMKSIKALNNAVSSYYKDLIDSSKFATSQSKPMSAFRPSTMLSTIIDVKGFRVHAICPVNVNGDETLVYGVNVSGDYFYNKNSKLTSYFTSFGLSYMNLLPVNSTYKVFYSKMKLKEAKYDTVPVISKALQAHYSSADSRIYVTNPKCLGVPDLPEIVSSNKAPISEEQVEQQFRHKIDVTFNALSAETKQLRHEFIRDFAEPLSCDIFKYANILKESDSNVALDSLPYLSVDLDDNSISQSNFDMNSQVKIDNFIDAEPMATSEALAGNDNRSVGQDSVGSPLSEKSGITDASSPRANANYPRTVEAYTSKLKQTMKLTNYLKGINKLYLKTMKVVAIKLDTLEYCPLDSYSLTEIIHKEGLCCRHLGLIYELCRTVHTKQIILVEIISRSIKTILNQSFRHFSRDCKLQVENYLQNNRLQGRSFQAENCQKLIDELNADFKHVVVDLFNLVLGFGNDVKEFWCGESNGVLMNVIFQKFGVELDFESTIRTVSPNVNQLFLAMQYHTGNLFNENCMFVSPFSAVNMSSSSSTASLLNSSMSTGTSAGMINKFQNSRFPKPLVVDDLLEAMQPLAKFDVRFPGLYLDVDSLCDSYLNNNLSELAIKGLQLRFLAYKAVYGDQKAYKVTTPIAWVIYKLALAYYNTKEFAQAKVLVLEFLYSNPKYNPICGRMTSLLMSIEMALGDFKQAMVYYETAVAIYRAVLGSSHPVHAIHAMALSDAYYNLSSTQPLKSDNINNNSGFHQAKAMTTLAYESLRGTLGDLHATTARFGLKLGIFYVESKQFDVAAELLSTVLLTFDIYSKRSIFYTKETAQCLHALALSLGETGQVQHAHHCATRCIRFYISGELILDKSVYIAMFLLMIQLSEKSTATEDRALSRDFIADLWLEAKRRPHAFGGLGEMLISLSVHIIHALFEKQTFAAKNLMTKIHDYVKDCVASREIKKEAYDRAILLVATNLWNGNAYKYFESLLELIQKMESSGMSGNIKDMVGHHTTETELVQIQVAILFAIVERHEGTESSLSGSSNKVGGSSGGSRAGRSSNGSQAERSSNRPQRM